MGVFHLECAASELPIIDHRVALFLVMDGSRGFAPIALPVRGDYDACGSIENVDENLDTARLLSVFQDLARASELTDGSDRLPPPETFADLLAVIRRGQVEGDWLRLGGRSLGFTLVLESVYAAVVRTVERDRRFAGTRRADLAKARIPELVTRALGDAEIARRLYAEASGRSGDSAVKGLVELVQFRCWFDTRGSWIPDPLGDHYAPHDIPPFIDKARTQLAEWPLVLEAIGDYEIDFETHRADLEGDLDPDQDDFCSDDALDEEDLAEEEEDGDDDDDVK